MAIIAIIVGTLSDESQLSAKYVQQDLGDGLDQVRRLTCPGFRWRNLNPFYVLCLDTDATDEDVKHRYRKLAAKVHPDKMMARGADQDTAREAFEQVKAAYSKLTDPDQKRVVLNNIQIVADAAGKDRRRLLAKGVRYTDNACTITLCCYKGI
jgi:thymidylate kinase